MYSKVSYGDHFYNDPESEGLVVELCQVVPAGPESGRGAKAYFHELEVQCKLVFVFRKEQGWLGIQECVL